MGSTRATEPSTVCPWRRGILTGIRRGDTAYYLDKEIAYGYITHPQGEKVTKSWLLEGDYQLESRGQLFHADLHMKTPFDSENRRLHGFYEADQALRSTQEEKMLDYRNLLNRASARYLHTSTNFS